MSVNLMQVSWELDPAGGYAHVARESRLSFQRHGATFVSSYLREWDALLAYCTPVSWIIGQTAQRRPDIVFHTMFEASPLPPGWVENLNNAGLIWVPSRWCEQLFRDHGVTTDILVSGYGVKTDQFAFTDRSNRSGPMKFVIWADTIPSRKNVILAARAFVAAGLPDAELEIKVHSFAGMSASGVMRLFTDSQGRSLSNIAIHAGSWPIHRIVAWLHSADCGIYLSGGEGFGLQPIQSGATGLPMIVACNTGMQEYLQPDSYMLVSCPHKIPSVSLTTGFNYPCEIYQPDFDEAVHWIRWAYEHRSSLWEYGNKAHLQAQSWNWDDQTLPIYNELCRRYGRA